jgi:hypothetical protein
MRRLRSIGKLARRSWPIWLSAAMFLPCGGCQLIPLTTVGAIFDIAGASVSAGPEVFSAGKLDGAFMVEDVKCRAAVRLAAKDLQLHIVHEHKGSGGRQRWYFLLQDDRKSNIVITVERRTPMLCWCRVDVGLFGSEPTAQLVMVRIKSRLPRSATGPA